MLLFPGIAVVADGAGRVALKGHDDAVAARDTPDEPSYPSSLSVPLWCACAEGIAKLSEEEEEELAPFVPPPSDRGTSPVEFDAEEEGPAIGVR